jgi:hypothetical protein
MPTSTTMASTPTVFRCRPRNPVSSEARVFNVSECVMLLSYFNMYLNHNSERIPHSLLRGALMDGMSYLLSFSAWVYLQLAISECRQAPGKCNRNLGSATERIKSESTDNMYNTGNKLFAMI